jgi:hypothetical protein
MFVMAGWRPCRWSIGVLCWKDIYQGTFLDLVSVAHFMLDNEGSYTQGESKHAGVDHKGQLTVFCMCGRLESDVLIGRTALFAALSLQQATGKSATAYTMTVDD